jgi:hypothetical protein
MNPTLEMITNGQRLLMVTRRKPDGTRKPLGPKQLAWIQARGWTRGPRVEARHG